MEYLDVLKDLFDTAGLWGVAISAFLSSTVLPGTSEVYALAYAADHPELILEILLTASIANTAGAMTTWGLGRVGARFAPVDTESARRLARWGVPVLFFSWVPVIGDGLTLAAGWIKTGFWASLFFVAAGKFARYAVLLWTAGQFFSWLWGAPVEELPGVTSI